MADAIAPAHADRTISIVIPVYNEHDLLPRLIERVRAANLPPGWRSELLVVDDGSSDGTTELLRQLEAEHDGLVACYHDRNRGKGAALRTGFARATGALVLVQDADLEYDPRDYPRLLAPLLDGRADVVLGSRFLGQTHRVLYFWHYVGNKGLTTLSNMLTNLNLTDMECCYKLFRREVLARITIQESRFGVEPELTAKVAHLGVRIYETPVSYAGRTYAEGKKINWRDGVSALRCILRYNLLPYAKPGGAGRRNAASE
ncbi:MAG: glycosyltransferase family 2 protein [Phycisphaeraceae bacterium]